MSDQPAQTDQDSTPVGTGRMSGDTKPGQIQRPGQSQRPGQTDRSQEENRPAQDENRPAQEEPANDVPAGSFDNPAF